MRLSIRHAIILAGLAGLLASATPSHAAVSVTVDSTTHYQTIRGWGAVFPWLMDVPDRLTQQVIVAGVNDLGLNCFRYEGPGGWSTNMTRWEWSNDDDDPLTINWAGLNTAGMDAKILKWVLPVKQAVEAQGDTFYLQVSPSFFDGGSTGSAPVWMLRNPGEYAEWATSMLLRLRDEHGIEADYYTICNEAGNNNAFTAPIVGRLIKTVGPRLEALGLSTRIEFPESINAYVAWTYIQSLQNDARVWDYVDVISYHLYGGTDYRDDLYAFAQARGLETAQTEFMASTGNAINHLYNDLTIGGVSEWEVYGQGFPVPDANRTSFTRSASFWSFRQIMPYVRTGAVRIGATSDTATVRPLAFADNGNVTVVLLNTSSNSAAQTVTVGGLIEGDYAVSQSVNKGVLQELGVQSVGPDGLLTLAVAKGAMLTIYPHDSGNLPPEPTSWVAVPDYLKIGDLSSTTLSVEAQDPELDSLSYQWSLVAAPPTAAPILANPTAASCFVVNLTVPGEYAFEVDVNDGVDTVTRQVMLNVYDGNQLPVLEVHNRIPVQLIQPASSTTLRVWAYDVDDAMVSYLWEVRSQPPGAAAVLASPTSTSCGVSGLTEAGEYVLRATADDGEDSAFVDLVVTVEPVDLNAPFIQNATVTVAANGCAVLSATTGDVDGDWTSHWWEMINGPADATVNFSNQGCPSTPVWTDTPGTYQFMLTVVDRAKYSISPMLTVTLGPASEPIAGDANLDDVVNLDDFVIFKQNFGSGTSWSQGNFDGGADVDLDDFVILKMNFGASR